jgi:hypothetical protein
LSAQQDDWPDWVGSSPSLFAGKADVQTIQGANDSNLRETGHWQRKSGTAAQAELGELLFRQV